MNKLKFFTVLLLCSLSFFNVCGQQGTINNSKIASQDSISKYTDLIEKNENDIEILNKSLTFFQDSNLPEYVDYTNLFIAKYYTSSQLLKSRDLINEIKVSEHFKKLPAEIQYKYCKNLSAVGKEIGDYELAYNASAHLVSVANKKYEIDKLKLSADNKEKLNAVLRTYTSELEISTLKKRKARLTLFYIISGLSLFILIGIYFVWQNLRKQRNYNRILENRSKELDKSNLELARKNEELERFAFISSHDLKTPLIPIIGFSELLAEEISTHKNSELKEYTSHINQAGQRMFNIIEDVLEYASLNNPQKDEHSENIDLEKLIKEIALSIKKKLRNKDISVIFDSDVKNIVEHKASIYSILQNLIENGVHYNESEIPTVIVKTRQTRDNIFLSFKDNGIGIPKSEFESVFKMFNRLHNEQRYPGTGLGLAIVNKVVRDLQGKITVESELNKGSVFSIVIPKKEDA